MHGLHEAEHQAHPHIRTLAGGVGVGPGAAEAAAEDITEDVAQIHAAEAAAKAAEAAIEAARAARACAVAGIHARKAELIVPGALFLVAQHLVGLVHFLELGLGLLVARVQVRVILFGLLAVRFFQFIVAGDLRNAKDLVIIAFVCHKFLT